FEISQKIKEIYKKSKPMAALGESAKEFNALMEKELVPLFSSYVEKGVPYEHLIQVLHQKESELLQDQIYRHIQSHESVKLADVEKLFGSLLDKDGVKTWLTQRMFVPELVEYAKFAQTVEEAKAEYDGWMV